MPLFEVAILERPTKKEAEEGVGEKLILKPTAVVAADNQSAAIACVMDQSELKMDKQRMEVLVRPFA